MPVIIAALVGLCAWGTWQTILVQFIAALFGFLFWPIDGLAQSSSDGFGLDGHRINCDTDFWFGYAARVLPIWPTGTSYYYSYFLFDSRAGCKHKQHNDAPGSSDRLAAQVLVSAIDVVGTQFLYPCFYLVCPDGKRAGICRVGSGRYCPRIHSDSSSAKRMRIRNIRRHVLSLGLFGLLTAMPAMVCAAILVRSKTKFDAKSAIKTLL